MSDEQIQGLPAGVTVDAPIAPAQNQIQGLPAGVTVDADPSSEAQMFAATTGGQAGPAPAPTPMQTVPSPSNIGSRAWQATKDEAGNIVQSAVAPVKAVIMPPQDASEHAIVNIGGPGALVAYRTAKGLHESAQNLVASKKENFQQAALDFSNALNEFHSRNYRAAVADTASLVSDMGSLRNEPFDTMGRTREIAQGTKEGGDLVTPVTKDVVDLGAAALAEKAPEIVRGVGKGVEATSEAAGKAAEKINTTELRPEMLTKRPETPAPQHGAPVKVESPLDGPTVGKQLGGKDLSREALDTLQSHVGENIPVGSTAKNRLTAAVEPTVRAINETATKMNKVVTDAPDFTTSVMQDSIFGEGKFTDEIEGLKKNLPPSVREALTPDVDAVMEDADKALNSSDPGEVLEYRRRLGNQIDWDKVEKNPTTAAEVQNAARVKVYRALGDKIHSEIPETVELDKQLAPNLELRSHIRSKLGDRVVDDPQAATAEAQSEFKKGKTTIDNAIHNEAVAKNWQRIKAGLIVLGVGGGVIHEIEKFLP